MRGGDKREVGCGFPEEQFNGANSFVEGTKQILGNVSRRNSGIFSYNKTLMVFSG